jgi:hypothetical protein
VCAFVISTSNVLALCVVVADVVLAQPHSVDGKLLDVKAVVLDAPGGGNKSKGKGDGKGKNKSKGKGGRGGRGRGGGKGGRGKGSGGDALES